MIPWVRVPDRYRKMRLRALVCCRLGFAVYAASLFTAYARSGRVALAKNCNSPRSRVKELLRLPSLPSGFGSSGMFGSRGVPTELHRSIFSFSRYLRCEIDMESGLMFSLG